MFRCSKALLLDLWSLATGHARRGSPSAGPHWPASPHVIPQPRARPWFGDRDWTSTLQTPLFPPRTGQRNPAFVAALAMLKRLPPRRNQDTSIRPGSPIPRQWTFPTGTPTDDDGAWRPELARKLLQCSTVDVSAHGGCGQHPTSGGWPGTEIDDGRGAGACLLVSSASARPRLCWM